MQNKQQYNYLTDPLVLAGFGIARGQPINEAVTAAAAFQHQQDTNKRAEQEFAQKQQQSAQQQLLPQLLPQILQESNPEDIQGNFIKLTQAGLTPQEAIVVASKFAEIANKNNPQEKLISGAGGLKYTQYADPETGETKLKPVPGQIEKPSITPAEVRINTTALTKLSQEAKASAEELRYLNDTEKYFKQFDKAEGVGSWTGAGSFIRRNSPESLQNITLSKQGQTAKQEIDKIAGLIFQNRVKGAGSNATDAFKEQVKKSLPTTDITRQARNELIETKARENLANIARSKFFSEWFKQNGKDLAGAEDAFIAYIDSIELLDKNNKINKKILKDIPQIVSEFLGKNNASSQDFLTEEEEYEMLKKKFGNE